MPTKRLVVLLAAIGLVGTAQAEMTFRSAPGYVPSAEAHQNHGHRRAPEIHIRGGEGAAFQLWRPELDARPLEPKGKDRIAVKPTGMNNYHALVAIREQGRTVEVATRYLYFHGKPADETPSALVAKEKAVFEIVPDPLPREHWRYLGGEPARFLVRYRGEPLPDHPVSLYTSNGTLLLGHTGPDGRWEATLPDDFAGIRAGRRKNRPGDFVVRTRYESGGREYYSTLNAAYSVNPSHWQSTGFGVLALAGGFISGLVVLRRAGRGGAA